MKKLLIGFLAVLLVVGITTPALAWGHGHRGGWGYRGGWHGGFWPGYAVGAFTGLAIGTLAAPYYYAPPALVYVAPPPPTCYMQPGYWSQVPVDQGNGFTTYQTVWVPGGYGLSVTPSGSAGATFGLVPFVARFELRLSRRRLEHQGDAGPADTGRSA